MWSIAPEQIHKKKRLPGISGYMRLKNEAEFLDRTITTHIDGLDELIVTFNDCSDETPEIAHRWAQRHPDMALKKPQSDDLPPLPLPSGWPISGTASPIAEPGYTRPQRVPSLGESSCLSICLR